MNCFNRKSSSLLCNLGDFAPCLLKWDLFFLVLHHLALWHGFFSCVLAHRSSLFGHNFGGRRLSVAGHNLLLAPSALFGKRSLFGLLRRGHLALFVLLGRLWHCVQRTELGLELWRLFG